MPQEPSTHLMPSEPQELLSYLFCQAFCIRKSQKTVLFISSINQDESNCRNCSVPKLLTGVFLFPFLVLVSSDDCLPNHGTESDTTSQPQSRHPYTITYTDLLRTIREFIYSQKVSPFYTSRTCRYLTSEFSQHRTAQCSFPHSLVLFLLSSPFAILLKWNSSNTWRDINSYRIFPILVFILLVTFNSTRIQQLHTEQK